MLPVTITDRLSAADSTGYDFLIGALLGLSKALLIASFTLLSNFF